MGFVYTNKDNWSPFAPMGFDGVFRGASVVFFAFLGERRGTAAVGQGARLAMLMLHAARRAGRGRLGELRRPPIVPHLRLRWALPTCALGCAPLAHPPSKALR